MNLLKLFKKKHTSTENKIIDFYTNYDEDGRLLRKSRLPEYLTTMRYIEKYLKPNSKIIEIGAGTGRYSIVLAEKGYDVTAVELVPHNIEIIKKKLNRIIISRFMRAMPVICLHLKAKPMILYCF